MFCSTKKEDREERRVQAWLEEALYTEPLIIGSYVGVMSLHWYSYLLQINIALALISNWASLFWTLRLMTWSAPPMNCCPMNTAGTLGRQPSWISALSTCCPFGILSTSITAGFAPKLHIRAFTVWLMQQLLLLNITTGLSTVNDANTSIIGLLLERLIKRVG